MARYTRPSRAGLGLALAGTLTFLVGEARAQRSAEVVAAVRGADGRAGSALLIGRSGQVYRPSKSGWQRTHLGGIALPVEGAVKTRRGQMFAVATRSPIYRYDGSAWHVHPLPNRGRAAIGHGRAPVIGLGHHVYVLRGEKWTLLGRARAPVVAVASSSATTAYALLDSGALHQIRGRGSRPVRVTLGGGDTGKSIIGGINEVYLVTKAGSLLRVRGLAAIPATLDSNLKGLRVHASATGPRGTLLAGVAGSTAVLALARNGKVARLHALPALAAGDRFGAIFVSGPSELLVATRAGVVHVLNKSGWQTRKVSLELPAAAQRAASHRPARAR